MTKSSTTPGPTRAGAGHWPAISDAVAAAVFDGDGTGELLGEEATPTVGVVDGVGEAGGLVAGVPLALGATVGVGEVAGGKVTEFRPQISIVTAITMAATLSAACASEFDGGSVSRPAGQGRLTTRTWRSVRASRSAAATTA
jgi:hypothetical protein